MYDFSVVFLILGIIIIILDKTLISNVIDEII